VAFKSIGIDGFKLGELNEKTQHQFGILKLSSRQKEAKKSCGQGPESELLHDWRFTVSQFVLAASPLTLTTSIFFQLNTYGHSFHITSSLTRGWACRLQLLLVLSSAVILRPESRGIHDHILLSQIRESFNLEVQVPVFCIPQEEGGPVIPSVTGFPFHRLLRLAALRWNYLTPPSHGI
jgi:hypothetical protein